MEDENITLLIRIRHEILPRARAYDLTLAEAALYLVLRPDAPPVVAHPLHAMLSTKVKFIVLSPRIDTYEVRFFGVQYLV